VDVKLEKRLAGEAAAALVENGMAVGLGTGSTVSCFLEALAARSLELRCVATSRQTEEDARRLGLPVEPFDRLDRLDLTVDGADQIAPDGWLVKGGGGAHAREKIAAAAADRFVVIASSDKLVDRIAAPIPLELSAYGLPATLRALDAIGETIRREAPTSLDGGIIADYLGPVDDPARLAAALDATPGVVAHGLFEPALVSLVLVGRGDAVERMTPGRGRPGSYGSSTPGSQTSPPSALPRTSSTRSTTPTTTGCSSSPARCSLRSTSFSSPSSRCWPRH
jgi:ribose 5-phosphate isomerase A